MKFTAQKAESQDEAKLLADTNAKIAQPGPLTNYVSLSKRNRLNTLVLSLPPLDVCIVMEAISVS
jgi:hypothetical protein